MFLLLLLSYVAFVFFSACGIVNKAPSRLLAALLGLGVTIGLTVLIVHLANPEPTCTYDCEGAAVVRVLGAFAELGWILGSIIGAASRRKGSDGG